MNDEKNDESRQLASNYKYSSNWQNRRICRKTSTLMLVSSVFPQNFNEIVSDIQIFSWIPPNAWPFSDQNRFVFNRFISHYLLKQKFNPLSPEKGLSVLKFRQEPLFFSIATVEDHQRIQLISSAGTSLYCSGNDENLTLTCRQAKKSSIDRSKTVH